MNTKSFNIYYNFPHEKKVIRFIIFFVITLIIYSAISVASLLIACEEGYEKIEAYIMNGLILFALILFIGFIIILFLREKYQLQITNESLYLCRNNKNTMLSKKDIKNIYFSSQHLHIIRGQNYQQILITIETNKQKNDYVTDDEDAEDIIKNLENFSYPINKQTSNEAIKDKTEQNKTMDIMNIISFVLLILFMLYLYITK